MPVVLDGLAHGVETLGKTISGFTLCGVALGVYWTTPKHLLDGGVGREVDCMACITNGGSNVDCGE